LGHEKETNGETEEEDSQAAGQRGLQSGCFPSGSGDYQAKLVSIKVYCLFCLFIIMYRPVASTIFKSRMAAASSRWPSPTIHGRSEGDVCERLPLVYD
jgi:hypothetical protein